MSVDSSFVPPPPSTPVSFDPLVDPKLSELSFADSDEKILGCPHYHRNCKSRAPCCDKFFGCRLCHDEESTHEINRKLICEMICMLCVREKKYFRQPVDQTCQICHQIQSRYLIEIFKLFDDFT